MWYVYFPLLSNGDVYVGSSNDLKDRIGRHSKGEVQSTKGFLPVKLLSYVAVEHEWQARNLEKYFKSDSGKAIAQKRLFPKN